MKRLQKWQKFITFLLAVMFSGSHNSVPQWCLSCWTTVLGVVTRQHEPKPACLSTHTEIENGKAVKPSARFHVMFTFNTNFWCCMETNFTKHWSASVSATLVCVTGCFDNKKANFATHGSNKHFCGEKRCCFYSLVILLLDLLVSLVLLVSGTSSIFNTL